MSIFDRAEPMTDAERQAALHRDRYGASAPWSHCNICEAPDSMPCPRSCTSAREDAEKADGIKVSYPDA